MEEDEQHGRRRVDDSKDGDEFVDDYDEGHHSYYLEDMYSAEDVAVDGADADADGIDDAG